MPFTNYAVLNKNVNCPDVVASEAVNRFLPANGTEALAYEKDGNLTSDGRWTSTWNALNRLTAMESKSTAPDASKHKFELCRSLPTSRVFGGFLDSTTNCVLQSEKPPFAVVSFYAMPEMRLSGR